MTRRGFTLIEMIVVMSLCTILFFSTTFLLVNYLRHWQKISNQSLHQQTVLFLVNKIRQDVALANIISPLSNSDRLIIYQGTNKIEFGIKNKKVFRKKNNYTSYLNDKGDVGKISFMYSTNNLVSFKIDQYQAVAGKRN